MEKFFSKFSKESLSKAKKALNHEEIKQYSQISHKVQAVIDRFHNSEYESIKTAAFFVLYFIQSNYGLEMLDVQKGEQFHERMNNLSSRFQLLAELKNITCYMNNKTPSESTLTDDMKSMGGEVVMIYKYYHLLLSKINNLFSQNELENNFQDHNIHREMDYIEWRIEEIMSFSKYYSLK